MNGQDTVKITLTNAPAAVDMNYPPHGISDTLKDFPDWIKVGCGDKRYYCPEKNATFAPDGVTPIKLVCLDRSGILLGVTPSGAK